MWLTEKEAEGKWCPQARKAYGHYSDIGRKGWTGASDIPGHNMLEVTGHKDDTNRKTSVSRIKCIASDCMAWRWLEDEVKDPMLIGSPADGPARGYCGAYGRPTLEEPR